jgi:hypothetical protein
MREEGKPCGNENPPQKTMHQKKKRKFLGNCVLHSKTIPQSMKLMLIESLREDVEIFMDLMKSFGNLSILVPIDPMDPSAPRNIPFWWKWNKIQSQILYE